MVLDFDFIKKEFARTLSSEKDRWMTEEGVKNSKTFYKNVSHGGEAIKNNLFYQNTDSLLTSLLQCLPKSSVRGLGHDMAKSLSVHKFVNNIIDFQIKNGYFLAKKKQMADLSIVGRGVIKMELETVDFAGSGQSMINYRAVPFNRVFCVSSETPEDVSTIYYSQILSIEDAVKKYPNFFDENDIKPERVVHLVERWSRGVADIKSDDGAITPGVVGTVATFFSSKNLSDVDIEAKNKKEIFSHDDLISITPLPEWCAGLKLGIDGLPFSIEWFDVLPGTITPRSPYYYYRDLHEFYNSCLRRIIKITDTTLKGVSGAVVDSANDKNEAITIKRAPVGGTVTLRPGVRKESPVGVAQYLAFFDTSPAQQQIDSLRQSALDAQQLCASYGGLTFAENSSVISSENATNKQIGLLSKIAKDKFGRMFRSYQESVDREYKGTFDIIKSLPPQEVITMAVFNGFDANEAMGMVNEISGWNFYVVTDQKEILDNQVSSVDKQNTIAMFQSLFADQNVAAMPDDIKRQLVEYIFSDTTAEKGIGEIVNSLFSNDEYKAAQQSQQAKSQEQSDLQNQLVKSQADFFKADAESKSLKIQLDALKSQLQSIEAEGDKPLDDQQKVADIAKTEAETNKIIGETRHPAPAQAGGAPPTPPGNDQIQPPML